MELLKVERLRPGDKVRFGGQDHVIWSIQWRPPFEGKSALLWFGTEEILGEHVDGSPRRRYFVAYYGTQIRAEKAHVDSDTT